LPRDVITFGNSGNCITLWRSMSRAYSDPLLRNSLLLWGRQPDAVSDLETAWNLRLPSGQVSAPTEAEQRPTFPIDNPTAIHLNHVRRELLTYSRGGVVPIDPAAVVAEQPVARYEVLPEEAGLPQLMLEGALERNQQGEFLIRKAMRFPAGLAAWHAVSFRLPKDIPVPTGDPLRSKVWSEDAGAFPCLSDHCKQPQR